MLVMAERECDILLPSHSRRNRRTYKHQYHANIQNKRHRNSEHDLRRFRRLGDIISEERAIGTVRLLLDRHGELLLQLLALETALSQNACKFSGETPFVVLSREEGDGLASLSATTWRDNVTVNTIIGRVKRRRYTDLYVQSDGCNPQS